MCISLQGGVGSARGSQAADRTRAQAYWEGPREGGGAAESRTRAAEVSAAPLLELPITVYYILIHSYIRKWSVFIVSYSQIVRRSNGPQQNALEPGVQLFGYLFSYSSCWYRQVGSFCPGSISTHAMIPFSVIVIKHLYSFRMETIPTNLCELLRTALCTPLAVIFWFA